MKDDATQTPDANGDAKRDDGKKPKNPDRDQHRVFVTAHGECFHNDQNCKALQHSRTVQEKRRCYYCGMH